MRRRDHPFVYAVIAAAPVAITAAAWHGWYGEVAPDHRPAFAVLALGLLLAELAPATWLRYGDRELTVSWAFAFALVLLGGQLEAVAAMALVAAVAEGIHTRRPLAIIANVAQLSLCLIATVAVVRLAGHTTTLARGEPLDLGWLATVVVGGAALYGLNAAIVATAVSLKSGDRLATVMRGSIAANLTGDGLLLPLAPILAVLCVRDLLLLPFVAVVVAAVSLTSRTSAVRGHEAVHDPLTGLGNRRLLFQRLAGILPVANQSNGDALDVAWALVLVDLDRFKPINDSYGHAVGDDVLRLVARRMQTSAPADAIVVRLGGDEFAVVLPCSGETAAYVAVSALRAAVREPMRVGELRLNVDASFGVAMVDASTATAEDLLAAADRAMYRAKFEHLGVVIAGSETSPIESPHETPVLDLRQCS